MAFSDSLLGFLIFIGLTLVSFLIFLIKEKLRPSKANAAKRSESNRTESVLSQDSTFESYEMQSRDIQQDAVISSDPVINDY